MLFWREDDEDFEMYVRVEEDELWRMCKWQRHGLKTLALTTAEDLVARKL
jgi:hypothetical protein